MPIHDWTRVYEGLFHDFRQGWTVALSRGLNAGRLPPDYFALLEKSVREPIPDVLDMGPPRPRETPRQGAVPLRVDHVPPPTRVVRRHEIDVYANRGNRVAIRHQDGDLVAVLEVISSGNKVSRAAVSSLVRKYAGLIRQGIHLLVIDLFPPGRHAPSSIPEAIWDEFVEEDFELPPDRPLTLAAYDAGSVRVAYVEPVAVGGVLPDMPLFLTPGSYIPVPLEETYQQTWGLFPADLKYLLEHY